MRRILFMCGLAVWLFSCANNGDATSGDADTATNPTTSSGAAGTGGVGAGFGTGGSPTTDTGKVIRTDTSGAENQQ